MTPGQMLSSSRLAALLHLKGKRTRWTCSWPHCAALPDTQLACTVCTLPPNLPQARSAQDPLCRLFARLALGGLPRGGGNGDDIR